jgi:hypothetical protein
LVHFGSIWRTLHPFPWTFLDLVWLFDWMLACASRKYYDYWILAFFVYSSPPDPHLHN